MADSVGTVRVDLVANSGKFGAGMRKASGNVSRFSSVVKKARGVMGSFGDRMTALVTVGGLVAFVKGTAEAYGNLGKFAKRIGIGVEELQRFHYAAEVSGVAVLALQVVADSVPAAAR